MSKGVDVDFEAVKSSGGIHEYRLKSNDLTVLLMEDHSAPVVTFMVTYLVGSRNEAIGYTGSTHLLEHMMFKGSTNYNKENGKTIWTELQNVGSVMNATTWNDRTNYFEMLPREHLEKAIAIESDRMRRALIRDKDRQPEMTVVRNEFERGENDPWETLDKNIWATAYQAHPYHHSTIGWKSDIEGVSTERLKAFYDTFYWPNNSTVTVIGDFDTQQVLGWIRFYFGQYTRSPETIPEMYTAEPKQEGARRLIVKRSGTTGIVGVAHKTPPGLHVEMTPFFVLKNILGSGKNSRFYRRLVDKGLATSVYVWDYPFRDNGLFITYAFMTPGTQHEDVEQIILEEYEDIKNNGVKPEELQRAKAQIRADIAFSLDGSYSIASAINEAIAIGDWTAYTTYLERIQAVTGEDIRNQANSYLTEEQSTTGWFIPEVKVDDISELVPFDPADSHLGPEAYRPESPDWSGSGPAAAELPLSGNVGSSPAFQTGGDMYLSLAEQMVDGEVLPGLRLVTMPMGVKEVVTIRGSFYGGDIFNPADNRSVADLTSAMLDQGTRTRDKFAISALLESVGASLNFGSDDYRVNFSARCLKEDVPLVVELLAEQLREPVFNESDLSSLRKRIIGELKRQSENTGLRARMKFNQVVYPRNHPNYIAPIEVQIGEVEAIKTGDLRKFHTKIYGLGSMNVVATGDIDRKILSESLAKHFAGWKTVNAEPPSLDGRRGLVDLPPQEEIVSMEDKTSVNLILGHVIGIDREHPDYLPLMMGNFIFGGNFSARLMASVRDEEGLTYGIRSSIGGVADGKDGYWSIEGTFAPTLIEDGRTSAMAQLEQWVSDGVTAKELDAKKNTLTGTFQVGLATTRGMASAILDILERGKEISYIDEFPDEINALTLESVNSAIRQYIRTGNLVVIAAGSIDTDWHPLPKLK